MRARVGQKNTLTRRWAKRGTRPSAPKDQRTASAYIFGAICPARGVGAGLVMPRCTTSAMAHHLEEISATVAPGAHAVLLLDQVGWHSTRKLPIPGNITLLPLPARSPELNPVENLWQFLRDNWLGNRIFQSYDDILDHCCDTWNTLIAQPWCIISIGLRPWAHEFRSMRAGIGPRRVLVLGATGTIGRATVRALLSRGHEVVCLVRRSAETALPTGAVERIADLTDPVSLARDGVRGEPFDVLVSCLASRTGLPDDAWAIDYGAQVSALHVSQAAGVTHVVLLSAICVQKPILAYQHAKLALEAELISSGLDYTIVRPTAFFKSLSGQIDRLKRGKSFLVFGDGTLTACKPISDDDLGCYLADCLEDDERRNRVLPIGGPGNAITPKAQGERLFALLGREPSFTHVPVLLLDVIVTILATIGRWVPSLAAKAELARIGRYYATESMLVLNPVTGEYDAQATPSTGSETLFDYYARVIRGEAVAERGDHAVF